MQAECEHPANELLVWLANGTLSGDEAAQALEHVTSCSICSRELEELREIGSSLRIHERPRVEPGGRPRRWSWVLAAAVVPLLLLALWVFRDRDPSSVDSSSGIIVLDLSGGQQRGEKGLAEVILRDGVTSVKITFIAPASAGPSSRVVVEDSDGRVIGGGALSPRDGTGRSTLSLPADRLELGGTHTLVIHGDSPGGLPRSFRYPFRVGNAP